MHVAAPTKWFKLLVLKSWPKQTVHTCIIYPFVVPRGRKAGRGSLGAGAPPYFFQNVKKCPFFRMKVLVFLDILNYQWWDSEKKSVSFLTVTFKITYCNLRLYVALCCALLVWHHKCASTYLYLILYIIELSKAQRSFANVLSEFRLECIGEIDTDDEMEIGMSLIWLLLKVLYWI